MRNSLFSAGAFAFALVFGSGCDNSPRRHAVSGTITFQKAPLKNGTITFYPVSTGTQAGEVITDGRYQIPRDKGLAVGKYRVSISSPDGETPAAGDAPPGPGGNFASKERVPPEFNEKSKHEIEVTAGGPNEFNFTIP